MNNVQIELALVLKELGLPLNDLGSFSKRFNIQKKIYLTQVMGVDLGYRFGWYIHGPYSSSLTSDAFSLKEESEGGVGACEDYQLHPDVKKRIEAVNELCQLPGTFTRSADDWIELLASIHYLKHIAYCPEGKTKDFRSVFAELVASKPKFKDCQIQAQTAWEHLDEVGLVSSKTLA